MLTDHRSKQDILFLLSLLIFSFLQVLVIFFAFKSSVLNITISLSNYLIFKRITVMFFLSVCFFTCILGKIFNYIYLITSLIYYTKKKMTWPSELRNELLYRHNKQLKIQNKILGSKCIFTISSWNSFLNLSNFKINLNIFLVLSTGNKCNNISLSMLSLLLGKLSTHLSNFYLVCWLHFFFFFFSSFRYLLVAVEEKSTP